MDIGGISIIEGDANVVTSSHGVKNLLKLRNLDPGLVFAWIELSIGWTYPVHRNVDNRVQDADGANQLPTARFVN